MAKTKTKSEDDLPKRKRPALTPDAEEKQMIALAMDNAREQLENRTASSQVICHFLKLASSKEQQEIENLKKDIELKDAKIENLKAAQEVEVLYADAIKAMRRYQGAPEDE